MSDPAQVLRYLADLAPRGAARRTVIRRRSDMVHLGWVPITDTFGVDVASRTAGLDHLYRLDRLHGSEQLLRLGWMFFVGRLPDGSTVTMPLVTVRVALERAPLIGGSPLGRTRLRLVSDPALPKGLVDDPAIEEQLNGEIDDLRRGWNQSPTTATLLRRHPDLLPWLEGLFSAMGLKLPHLVDPEASPWDLRDAEPAVLATGVTLYLSRDVDAPTTRGDLLTWASRDVTGTALDALYRGGGAATPPAEEGIDSPYPLNTRQRAVMLRARRDPITVVSGPPGTGKSHTVAALAVDEIGRGRSVLIATQSDHAADVISGMLDAHPGPRYVRFGHGDHRRRVADELSSGLAEPFEHMEVQRLQAALDQARADAEGTRRRITKLLERQIAFTRGLQDRQRLAAAGSDAPGALQPGFALGRAQRMVARLDGAGWMGRLRGNRARRRLARMLDAAGGLDDDVLRDAVALAAAEHAVTEGLSGGGIRLAELWATLDVDLEALRAASGAVIEARRRARERSGRAGSAAVASLATALRAGPIVRRRMLRDLRSSAMLDVLPLWVGTLTDIDDVLPLEPGMFDVVIFDEASQIDQMRAAPALARARRAVVVGDPRQLRHVSFISDDVMAEAVAEHGIRLEAAPMLDARRNSLFDAAAGAGPVTQLDEHFRSLPHLIGFSDRHFYSGSLRLMTQHPASETRDAIDVVHVLGERNDRGVNLREVEAVLRVLEEHVAAGTGSIGVATPFRAHADALEERILERFSEDQIERFGMRVGTVHAFQGNERDVMVLSTAIGTADARRSLRFIEDPNLFNVMVTRARQHMFVVTSLGPDELPDGLLRRYLRHADESPPPPQPAGSGTPWVREVAERLRAFGVRVVVDYPVAGWTVDLAVGDGNDAIGVECNVHPDGPAVHIERHLALRRAGWVLAGAFQSRWLADPDGAVADIVQSALGGVPTEGGQPRPTGPMRPGGQ